MKHIQMIFFFFLNVGALELTCEYRISDFSVASRVFVQSLYPDNLRACWCPVGDAGLVAGA